MTSPSPKDPGSALETAPGPPDPEQAPSTEPTGDKPPSHPPLRGLRAMAIVRWALLLLVSIVAVYNVVTIWAPDSRAQSPARPDRYYCSMHPQIRSPDPGTCPICNMDLVPIPADRQAAVAPPSTATVTAHAHGSTPAPAPAAPAHVHGDSPRGTAPTGEAPAAPAAPASGLPPPPLPPGLVSVSLSLERQQLIGVTTAAVAKGPLANRLRVPATIEAPQSGLAEVRVRAAGFIESVAVRETGVQVKRGQPLAYMWSPDIHRAQEELLAAHRWSSDPAAAAMGGKTAADMTSAARRGLELLGLSKGDIDAILRSGKASRTVAIRAPQTGVVTKFYAVLGTRAMPEAPLYEIADLSKVWVIASVHERDLPHVRQGTTAELKLQGRPDEARAAKVDLVEPDVSPVTRTARVRLTLQNKDLELRPGQYGEVSFELPATTSLLVPRDAVIDTGKAQYVFVVAADGHFEPRAVRVGTMVEDQIQITAGLQEAERVVTRGSFLIDSESRLRGALLVSPAAAPEAAPTAPAR